MFKDIISYKAKTRFSFNIFRQFIIIQNQKDPFHGTFSTNTSDRENFGDANKFKFLTISR